VYEKKPRTTVDLKQNIREEVAAFSSNMLPRVAQKFQKRLGDCVERHTTSHI
jgi:carbon monoxide dehydrogenase subunit G